jgi:hypothetical protein
MALATALAACGAAAQAQQSFGERFDGHNAALSALQPALITPLVEPEPRLIQYARASFSHEYTAARTETMSYGNNRGGGVTMGDRFELDFMPPPYIQHNLATAKDGMGDTTAVGKVRIASGNAQHGNFDVAALLSHCFATGSYKNGALTDNWGPTVASAYVIRRVDVQTSLGGTMPTGKIAAQGRSIAWNSLMQAHVKPHVWLELENNATFYFSGSHDGKMQNFITPAAFYVLRPKEWQPAHPFMIFDGGMQIATSGFHAYNHNLILESRLLF